MDYDGIRNYIVSGRTGSSSSNQAITELPDDQLSKLERLISTWDSTAQTDDPVQQHLARRMATLRRRRARHLGDVVELEKHAAQPVRASPVEMKTRPRQTHQPSPDPRSAVSKPRSRSPSGEGQQSIVPRRIRSVEDLVQLWRRGDPSRGCLFPLRSLQSAEQRKQLIPDYSNSWWISCHHKDSLKRYRTIVREVTDMLPGRLNMMDGGCDDDWKEALDRFHCKWDVGGKPDTLSGLVTKLRKSRN